MGKEKKQKPNILFFYIDGMQGRVLNEKCPCQTPNFDRIAKEGVMFTNALTCNPTCSPARACLMTGLLPHNHGVLQVEHCVDDDQSVLRTDKHHWPQHLEKAGYKTGYWGKWHIERSYQLDKFGWQEHCSEKTERYLEMLRPLEDEENSKLDKSLTRYQTGPDGYDPILHYAVTDAVIENRPISLPGKLGKKFLEKVLKKDQPWCCCVSNSAPNEQMYCGREAFELYNLETIDLPKSLNDKLDSRPALYKRTQQLWSDITVQQWKEARACYYGRITELDAEFGKLLKMIEDAGQLENTVILITSDHGKYVGAHGLEAHNFGAFEELYNIPLILAGPGISKDKKTNAQVLIQDICPTMLDLTGSEPINEPDSKSFIEVLQNPKETEAKYNSSFGEYHGTRFPLMQRIYRENKWKYVFNGFDNDELYDLEEDPHELNNLAELPEHKERICSMMTKIWETVHATNDKAIREPTTYIKTNGLYSIPYRCLYSRNIENLFIGGRAISVSHMAFGSTRVMATCGVVGQAIGTAAHLCCNNSISPRELASDVSKLQSLLMKNDCYLHGMKDEKSKLLFENAVVTASSYETGAEPENTINGYQRNINDKTNCWIAKGTDEWLDIRFNLVKEVKEFIINFDSNLSEQFMISISKKVTDVQIEGIPPEIVKEYKIQFYKAKQLLLEIPITNNYLRHNHHKLKEMICCDRIHIEFKATHGYEKIKVFEVKVY